ncbi:hypothetical protein AB4Z48_16775 [Cupriavidus sp. 2TAF22]|uniref:hypothetical protein n=1 Tax=unclassified Cupriavidus TaxID=2640874 RepID=UPI003F8DCB5E
MYERTVHIESGRQAWRPGQGDIRAYDAGKKVVGRRVVGFIAMDADGNGMARDAHLRS